MRISFLYFVFELFLLCKTLRIRQKHDQNENYENPIEIESLYTKGVFLMKLIFLSL